LRDLRSHVESIHEFDYLGVIPKKISRRSAWSMDGKLTMFPRGMRAAPPAVIVASAWMVTGIE
jgi:hypothetical protein